MPLCSVSPFCSCLQEKPACCGKGGLVLSYDAARTGTEMYLMQKLMSKGKMQWRRQAVTSQVSCLVLLGADGTVGPPNCVQNWSLNRGMCLRRRPQRQGSVCFIKTLRMLVLKYVCKVKAAAEGFGCSETSCALLSRTICKGCYDYGVGLNCG